ncbi:hypothetical protein, conserved [Entamoeba dispar SAW760]|uniref:Rab-GAP TBC domain-containing protein n=1 Tax=Entamoeba dispar (strain ATCC PRA-260 / SAW760) TaxID=370354 RepID=B0ERT4_ENTDS|nr:uncharacterized protein EDI_336280 [Entamoeba dispar SAW760]EDR22729.1 hypothetical protein, conserved [Entamoeba dispar SAW760]|eukprot:EDR22729.1 hypothetical protein, conserved [Entamoeba dispar SAW760]
MDILTEDAIRGARSIIALYNSIVGYTNEEEKKESEKETEPKEIIKKEEKNEQKISKSPTLIKLEKILSKEYIDIKQLKDICWVGCPSEYRREVWKILLQCHPLDKNKKENFISKRIEKYEFIQTKFGEERNVEQISKDLLRISEDLNDVRESMKRILSLWAARHPASGYVQGIHDILIPIIRVYYDKKDNKYIKPTIEQEADSFDSLTFVLETVQNFYTCQQPRIFELLKQLELLIKKINPSLSNHLEAIDVHTLNYAFRWFNCFLLREFSPEQGIRLFDTLISDQKGFAELPLFLCVALINKYSSELQQKDFGEAIIFLQNLPTSNWTNEEMDTFISQAHLYRELYSNSHLM